MYTILASLGLIICFFYLFFTEITLGTVIFCGVIFIYTLVVIVVKLNKQNLIPVLLVHYMIERQNDKLDQQTQQFMEMIAIEYGVINEFRLIVAQQGEKATIGYCYIQLNKLTDATKRGNNEIF
ncbi:hypothetical protein [Yersinia mollaretii]|uniref:hypothetical protein n=1 Tax=Yersinia mollaretii TaxID=33060 RepID=UPI0011A5117C|nr:hypothetical protein [Yersinia mollaretii]